jgi:nucleotide-binding universal stress UspA family protein
MYQCILLTLDRSPLAEQALPHAVALARACEARLELLSVVPLSDGDHEASTSTREDGERQGAETRDYLAGMAARLEEEGLQVGAAVRFGDVAAEVLHHAEASEADLIVMATHGRSGLGRWVYGSVADHVLRHATMPVLLVRATE